MTFATFTPEQIAALDAPLSSSHVTERTQAGRRLSYIESWRAIAEANRIFGYGSWSSETIETKCVAEHPRKIGQAPRERDGFGVSYIAKVRVQVGDVVREGVGAGHGIDVDLGLAHESAIKESEADARKRALMTFGNPFGLALYDKEQRNVADEPAPPRNVVPLKPQAQEDRSEALGYLAIAKSAVQLATSVSEITDWWKAEGMARKKHGVTNGTPEFAELVRICEAREAEIVAEVSVPLRAG